MPAHAADNAKTQTPVLIVGAGPAGMTSALSLARLGVRSILLTRYPNTAHTPRAHVINQRTMEIFRALGIEDRVTEVADPMPLMANNPWVTSLAGLEITRIYAWGNGHERQRYADSSPSEMCNYPQHLLEPILMRAIEETGLVDVRFGHEYVDHVQDEHGVVSRIRARDSGHEYSVASEYLVGADGARSQILEQLGIEPEGLSNIGKGVFVWFEADLSKYVAHRPGILYHSIIPDDRVGIILVRPWNEWIGGWPLDADFDATDHDTIRAPIHKFIGDTSVRIKIKNISQWEANANSAPQYSSGRVFCMGDAVHRHSPWNGLGLNTGVADAYNLAWKLKLVLDSTADSSLLRTYDAERVPIGRQVIRRVNETMAQMRQVPGAIGNMPGMPVEQMLRNAESLFDETEEAAGRRRNLNQALEPLRTTGFNALGAELGYRYREGAIVADGTPEPLPQGDPDYDYLATTWPGARMPHAWLENGRKPVSSLDVVSPSVFTLLVGCESAAWREAVAALPDDVAPAVEVVQIGGVHGVRDAFGDWARVRGVGENGAVLVRPDRHVGWRAADAAGSGQLADVLRLLLGRHAETMVTADASEPADAASLAR